MQRILSFQTSRNAGRNSSEFVTKRLCCSFLFSVAFLSLLGGFLLGRYATDRAILLKNVTLHLKQHNEEIHSLEIMENLTNSVRNINGLIMNVQVPDTIGFVDILKCSSYDVIGDTGTVQDLKMHAALKTSKILSAHLESLSKCFANIQAFLEDVQQSYTFQSVHD